MSAYWESKTVRLEAEEITAAESIDNLWSIHVLVPTQLDSEGVRKVRSNSGFGFGRSRTRIRFDKTTVAQASGLQSSS
jgi:hypothetical protein